jgi:hypothetical protein
MKKLLVTTAFIMLAVPAFASQCPNIMKEIDAALESGTSISQTDLDQVMSLRAEGETQHKSGDHATSVSSLNKAKEILGIN